jgi:hypothetical protein
MQLSVDAARDCYQRLTGEGVDLGAHNTTESAADFADLRIALRIADYRVYLEDHRPNSQGDPYQIASQI